MSNDDDTYPQDDVLIVTDAVRVPYDEFTFTFMRSSGPGGQNVNKVNTKARLRWNIAETEHLRDDIKERFVARYKSRITIEGDFLLTSQKYRDQSRNVADCLEKLRSMIAAVVEPPVERKKRKVSRTAKRRRVQEKRRRSAQKRLRQAPRMDD